ncbi:MAG: hypothetical protein ACHP93_01240, partial [Solirubrobacterales bacterium]
MTILILALIASAATPVNARSHWDAHSASAAIESETWWWDFQSYGTSFPAEQRPSLMRIPVGSGSVGRVPTVVLGDGVASRPGSLRWSSWGGPTATATGQAELERFPPHALNGLPTRPVRVVVTLSGQQPCGGAHIYTSLSVALLPGERTPTEWSLGLLEKALPGRCWPVNGCAPGSSSCHLEEYVAGIPFAVRKLGRVEVSPSPFGEKSYSGDMTLRSWGTSSAVGTGILNPAGPVFTPCTKNSSRCANDAWYYGMRYTLSNPRWCAGGKHPGIVNAGLHYTEATVEVFGPDTDIALVPMAHRRSAIHKLLRNIGRAGVPRKVI